MTAYKGFIIEYCETNGYFHATLNDVAVMGDIGFHDIDEAMGLIDLYVKVDGDVEEMWRIYWL